MIDSREDVLTSPATAARRRRTPVTATRPSRRETVVTGKSLPIKRVFSDAKVKPFDQIE